MAMTARCTPGDTSSNSGAAKQGNPVALTHDESQGDLDSFLKEGGFGPECSLLLVCDDNERHNAIFTSVTWTEAGITANIPDHINCDHTVSPSSKDPAQQLREALTPRWTYHIEAWDTSGGQSDLRFNTGPLWVVGDSNSGYPPLRG